MATSSTQESPAAVALSRAVHAVFGEWTAMKLAVEMEWGGSGTRDRALALLQRVLSGLLSTATVHRDELQDLLEEAMLDDFNVEAEDESCAQVAELLCKIHSEALVGGTATADLVLGRNAGRSSWVTVPPPPRVRGEDDSDSDDTDCDDDDAAAGGGPCAMDDGEGRAPRRPEPVVDDDGFQMVQTRGRRK